MAYKRERDVLTRVMASFELRQFAATLDDEDLVSLGYMMEAAARKAVDLYSVQNRLPFKDGSFLDLLMFHHPEIRSQIALISQDGNYISVVDFSLPSRRNDIFGISYSNRHDLSIFNKVRADALESFVFVGVR